MLASTEISYTDITEVYLQELRRGNRVSVPSLAKKFPQFADRILAELPMMAALETDLGSNRLPLPKIPGYQLIEEIGHGTSGVVYKAKHDRGKLVAIKLVRFDREIPNFARLDREIESLSRLSHPHVVTIESFGTSEDYVYIVTNLIEGITLAELLEPKPSVQAMYWISSSAMTGAYSRPGDISLLLHSSIFIRTKSSIAISNLRTCLLIEAASAGSSISVLPK